MATTGERLTALMAHRGISKNELALMTGLSWSTIVKVSHGDMVGNLYTWHLISDALGVPIDWFTESRPCRRA